jgi:tetratricopeptide (TPR) repeat protein
MVMPALLLPMGCSDDGLDPRSQEHLEASLASYRAGDNTATITQADAILAEHRRGETAMQAYYLRGMARYRLEQYDAARPDLEYVSRKTDDESLRIKALDALGELAYRQGRLAEAARDLLEVVEQILPSQKPADHAHFRLGCIRQKEGRWKDADVHFQRVMYYFSGSKLARRSRLRAGGRAWTVQLGSFGNRSGAAAEAKQLSADCGKVNVEPVMRNGKLVFLLQIGRWNQYSRAAAELSRIRKIKADAFLQVTR